MRNEEWILSTAARWTTLHGHCVSLMCIQNKASTITWKQRLVKRRRRVCAWCSTAPGSHRVPMTQSALSVSFANS